MKSALPLPKTGALVLGATGAVGGNIVRALLRQSAWPRITTLGRKAVPAWSDEPALTQRLTDVFDPEAYGPFLQGHSHAFCAFGIGEPSKLPPSEFQRVDIDAVFAFASACRKHGVRHFTQMTTVGADPRSRIRYLRLKGELEAAVDALGFERTSHFRPSMLMTPTNRYGWSQGFLLKAMPVFDLLLHGDLRKYRSIDVAVLGSAMVANSNHAGTAQERLTWAKIQSLAAQ